MTRAAIIWTPCGAFWTWWWGQAFLWRPTRFLKTMYTWGDLDRITLPPGPGGDPLGHYSPVYRRRPAALQVAGEKRIVMEVTGT
jgi:hypothetical protein